MAAINASVFIVETWSYLKITCNCFETHFNLRMKPLNIFTAFYSVQINFRENPDRTSRVEDSKWYITIYTKIN